MPISSFSATSPGPHVARFAAQRIAHHIGDLVRREEQLGNSKPN